MSDGPTVSVIIPVYNGERFLAEAIRSALDQTLSPAEIIVIDDGSTDASAEVARGFGPPVRVLAQANLGPAAARNLGVAHAAGDLLAFLDADDLWMPEKLAYQVQFLCRPAGIGHAPPPAHDQHDPPGTGWAARISGHVAVTACPAPGASR